MVNVNLSDLDDFPIFTIEERRRIDKCYRELRRKHDAAWKAGVKYVRLPPDFCRDNADKVRHAAETAGVPADSIYR